MCLFLGVVGTPKKTQWLLYPTYSQYVPKQLQQFKIAEKRLAYYCLITQRIMANPAPSKSNRRNFLAMKTTLITCLLAVFFSVELNSQVVLGKTYINGSLVTMMLDKNGDTLFVADDLMTISLTSPRSFKDAEAYNRYRLYLRYAAIVYPYAREAIAVFNQLNQETEEMRKGKRRRYAKKLQKDLDDKFEEPLKNLTKTQGKILVKMVERELQVPLYDLIKTYRGGLTAGYWNTMSKFWGYDLKRGYMQGDDPILDAVLEDFILSQTSE